MAKKKITKGNIKQDVLQDVHRIPGQTSREITTSYKKLPLKSTESKIHPRQIIPALKKGKQIPDETPTPPIKIQNK